jgi:UDP-N-acetylmuramate dehydrogenase
MNAGAFGGETWNHVVSVEVINRQGNIIKRHKKDYNIGYRSVNCNNNFNDQFNNQEWFVSAVLFFEVADKSSEDLQKEIQILLQKRKATQPIGSLNCGSVFKNPTNNFAAKLIESAKLKGERIGEAMVSTKHANFIINLGNATAKDLEALINLVQKKVFIEHNILLELEVKIIGK